MHRRQREPVFRSNTKPYRKSERVFFLALLQYTRSRRFAADAPLIGSTNSQLVEGLVPRGCAKNRFDQCWTDAIRVRCSPTIAARGRIRICASDSSR